MWPSKWMTANRELNKSDPTWGSHSTWAQIQWIKWAAAKSFNKSPALPSGAQQQLVPRWLFLRQLTWISWARQIRSKWRSLVIYKEKSRRALCQTRMIVALGSSSKPQSTSSQNSPALLICWEKQERNIKKTRWQVDKPIKISLKLLMDSSNSLIVRNSSYLAQQ